MQFNPSGLIVTVVFFGLLWFAVDRGLDYGIWGALVALALNVALGWLLLGVVAESPLPWPRRRARK
jgi:hypothetical protein